MIESKYQPINGVHGTIVRCESNEEAFSVFEFIEPDRTPDKQNPTKSNPLYVGTNTKGGRYILSQSTHALAGEILTFDEFYDSNIGIDLYKTLGMEEI